MGWTYLAQDRGIFLDSQNLFVSQEGPCSMQSVSQFEQYVKMLRCCFHIESGKGSVTLLLAWPPNNL